MHREQTVSAKGRNWLGVPEDRKKDCTADTQWRRGYRLGGQRRRDLLFRLWSARARSLDID